jgi:hypothetical protein
MVAGGLCLSKGWNNPERSTARLSGQAIDPDAMVRFSVPIK